MSGVVHNTRVRAEIRAAVVLSGTEILAMSEFTLADLTGTWWSETPGDDPAVAALIERVPSGDVDYVALRAPGGQAVARGCVTYFDRPGTGTISQISTIPGLRGLGIGTRLLLGMEDRMVARGATAAMLAVLPDNHGARRLYERLGYVDVGERSASWATRNRYGTEIQSTYVVTDLRKELVCGHDLTEV